MNGTAIRTEELSKRFGPIKAVDGVSLSVLKGEVIGLMGANGTGKTTLIRMLSGVLRPSSGRAWIAGCDLTREPGRIKRKIGYMGQSFLLFEELTVKENVEFYGTVYGMSPREIKQRIGELDRGLDVARYYGKRAGTLPSGWARMLAFLTAMIHSPEIVFLDEPTSGLDALSRRNMWVMIRRAAYEGTTILVSTHFPDETAHCDRVMTMDKGKIL